jgi:hypothetical protein
MLEEKIDKLTEAVYYLAKVMKESGVPAPVVKEEVKPAPVVKEEVKPEPTMPAPPELTNPTPEPVVDPAVQCPFNDKEGLIAYVMDMYTKLGADKGSQIQGVLSNLGFANINDVTSDKYIELYLGIEGLS